FSLPGNVTRSQTQECALRATPTTALQKGTPLSEYPVAAEWPGAIHQSRPSLHHRDTTPRFDRDAEPDVSLHEWRKHWFAWSVPVKIQCRPSNQRNLPPPPHCSSLLEGGHRR